MSVSSPTSTSSPSRGSTISMARTVCRAATAVSSGRQSSGPRKSEMTVTRPAVVRDAATVWRARRIEVGPPPSSGTSAWSARSRPAMPLRPPDGGVTCSRPAPNVTTPRRSLRRATNRPTTSAAPSATSALRRSAVPKCIDGEVSRTSHAVSWRSGTSSRTCGTTARAVAFQSIRRTSSPGSYGRMRSRSSPSPRPRPRWSPTIRPPTRRLSVNSSRRTRSSAIGPGTGPGGRSLATGGPSEVGHAVGSIARSSCGAGTSLRIRPTTVSAVMPSVRAA